MSVFANKLDAFLGNAWDSQIDINLCNELIKHKQHMKNDQMGAQQYIMSFIQDNQRLIAKASLEFQQKIKNLTTYMTEEYHGVWEHCSLGIYMKNGKTLSPELVKSIQRLGFEDYSMRIRPDIEKPKELLIVPKIPISKIVTFEKEIKKLNPKLAVKLVQSTQNYNIASKVNKQNAKKQMSSVQDDVRDPYIEETINKYQINQPEMEKTYNTIEEVYNRTAELLTEANSAFETNSLFNFVKDNFNKVKNICESATSEIDTQRLIALMESKGSLTETTTADMAVMDTPISLMRNRVAKFNPYGKNIGNAADKSGAIIKMDADVLKEAIGKFNMNKLTVLGTDIDTTNKYSRVIVEHEQSKHQLVIDRNAFLNFVQRNADVKNYIEEGKVNFKRYFKSRTAGFMGNLIKEFLKTMVNPNTEKDFQVDNYEFDNDMLKIYYFFPQDENYRIFSTQSHKFEQYLEDYLGDEAQEFYTHNEGDVDFENPRGTYSFDFEKAWDTFDIREKYNILKNFMNTQGNFMTEKKELKESEQVNDYNQWKSAIATNSNNLYDIRRAKNSADTIAVDGKGKTIGTWSPNKSIGYIYK